MNEEEQINTVSIGTHAGNVHLIMTTSCGAHEKVLSAKSAREMGNALIRLADETNESLPSLDSRPESRPSYLLILACAVIVVLALRK